VHNRLAEKVERLWRNDEGQDLVEYALLILLIVLGTVAIWNAIVVGIGVAYGGYDTSLWDLFWRAPGT